MMQKKYKDLDPHYEKNTPKVTASTIFKHVN